MQRLSSDSAWPSGRSEGEEGLAMAVREDKDGGCGAFEQLAAQAVLGGVHHLGRTSLPIPSTGTLYGGTSVPAA